MLYKECKEAVVLQEAIDLLIDKWLYVDNKAELEMAIRVLKTLQEVKK